MSFTSDTLIVHSARCIIIHLKISSWANSITITSTSILPCSQIKCQSIEELKCENIGAGKIVSKAPIQRKSKTKKNIDFQNNQSVKMLKDRYCLGAKTAPQKTEIYYTAKVPEAKWQRA